MLSCQRRHGWRLAQTTRMISSRVRIVLPPHPSGCSPGTHGAYKVEWQAFTAQVLSGSADPSSLALGSSASGRILRLPLQARRQHQARLSMLPQVTLKSCAGHEG